MRCICGTVPGRCEIGGARLTEFDPKEWVHSMLDLYTPLFEERGTKLTSHVDASRVRGIAVQILGYRAQHDSVGRRNRVVLRDLSADCSRASSHRTTARLAGPGRPSPGPDIASKTYACRPFEAEHAS